MQRRRASLKIKPLRAHNNTAIPRCDATHAPLPLKCYLQHLPSCPQHSLSWPAWSWWWPSGVEHAPKANMANTIKKPDTLFIFSSLMNTTRVLQLKSDQGMNGPGRAFVSSLCSSRQTYKHFTHGTPLANRLPHPSSHVSCVTTPQPTTTRRRPQATKHGHKSFDWDTPTRTRTRIKSKTHEKQTAHVPPNTRRHVFARPDLDSGLF